MAQTVSPPPADAPRPLPRRGATSPKGVRAPRLVPQDIFWTVALALLALTASFFVPNSSSHGMAGPAYAAGTTGLLYLLGWRARDRATGIIAALLLATSLPFAAHAVAAPREALAVLLATASLFAFVAGSSLLALAFAGLGALARPDVLLLGLLLLLVSLAQRRRRAVWGAAFFLGIVCFGGGILYGLGHTRMPAMYVGARDGLLLWAAGPGMVFSTWLLLPFCAELGEAPRRARWLPVVLWTLILFCRLVLCPCQHSGIRIRPAATLVCAGGGRAVPDAAGDHGTADAVGALCTGHAGRAVTPRRASARGVAAAPIDDRAGRHPRAATCPASNSHPRHGGEGLGCCRHRCGRASQSGSRAGASPKARSDCQAAARGEEAGSGDTQAAPTRPATRRFSGLPFLPPPTDISTLLPALLRQWSLRPQQSCGVSPSHAGHAKTQRFRTVPSAAGAGAGKPSRSPAHAHTGALNPRRVKIIHSLCHNDEERYA